MNKRRRGLITGRGFTLVEAVTVIVITGILASIVAVFIRAPIEGYLDAARRAELTDAADTALRRIARDVRAALPNSVREPSPANDKCIEFLPTVGGGRYRVAQSSAPTGDVLDFTAADSEFDVLANVNLPPTPGFATAPYHAVIYNLGIPGADAYALADRNRAQIAGASTAAHIVLTAPNQFPFASPGMRFHVIPDQSVVYSCSGDKLYRSTAAIASAPLATCPAAGTVLVGNVDCTQSAFTYTAAVSPRYGLLTMTLVLTQAGESIRLYQEVHVNNVP